MAWHLGGEDVLALASGLALVAFGVSLIRLGRRLGPSLVLGLFTLFWGIQVLLIRLWVTSDGTVVAFSLAGQAVTFALFPLVVHFAAVFPRRLRVTESPAWLALLAAPSVGLLAAFALDQAFSLTPSGSPVPFRWGWAVILLGAMPFLIGLTFALARFAHAHVRAPQGREREQTALCALALALYLSYFLAAVIPEPMERYVANLGTLGAALYKGSQLASAAAVAATAILLFVRDEPRRRGVWAAAFLVPAASALTIDTTLGGLVGLWRLAAVGLLYYGVARFHLLDIDLRLRATARWTAMAALGVAVWGITTLVAARALGAVVPPLWVTLAALVPGLAAAALARPATLRHIDRRFPYIRASEEYLLRRRIEVYRAAAESGTDMTQLGALARELHLKPEERLILDRANSRDATIKGGLVAGRYAIKAPLAPGVFGRVLLARDERLGDDVVLKEFRGFAGAAASKSFAREAKALGELEHPHIVRVRDVFRAGDDMFLVTEYANGGDLDDRLARSGPLAEDEALRIAEQVLAGLAKAHRKGIVHRDIKPSNILFHRGEVRLCDFGVALDPVLDGALRAARAQPGTLGWMAPEQARGDGATPASDVYSVGAVLYRMLAGRHYVALDGLGEQAARRAILEGAAALPLSGISPATNALMARALAKEPEDRCPHAAAMLADARRALRQPANAQTLHNPQPYGAGHSS